MRSTIVAFLANLGIAVAKLLAWSMTGSAAMLAEVLHSTADTGNQALLLFGRRRSRRAPTRRHPFGFGRERYFWSFVVALVLFSGGGLFALIEGEEKLRRPSELSSFPWSVAVLVVSMALEGFSLRTAAREARRRKSPGTSWWQFIQRTTVPELAVIVLEDFGALTGLLIALVGTSLAEATGNARFDAMGSLGIGLLLVVIAWTLAVETKSLLIGEAASDRDLAKIYSVLERDVRVLELRTELLGPDAILVVGTVGALADAEVDLDLVERNVREHVPSVAFIYLRTASADTRPTAAVNRPG
jgi:cation diffusion facilitator family transporter